MVTFGANGFVTRQTPHASTGGSSMVTVATIAVARHELTKLDLGRTFPFLEPKISILNGFVITPHRIARSPAST
jgi:hypothetical protein